MNLALAVIGLGTPAPFRKKVLRRLILATARAFGVEPISTRGLSARELLRGYALFTREEAERLWAERGDESAVERRLFDGAREIGTGLRRRFRLRSREDVLRMSRALYRILGIDFAGRPDGSIAISRCAFSPFYTARVCRLMSALDAGAAAGLSGGGELEFTQRITEGHDCCRARLAFKE
jgi:hypothetical protein